MGYWSDSVYQLHTRDSKTRFFMYTTIHSFVVLVILVMLNLFGKKKFNPRIVDGVVSDNVKNFPDLSPLKRFTVTLMNQAIKHKFDH